MFSVLRLGAGSGFEVKVEHLQGPLFGTKPRSHNPCRFAVHMPVNIMGVGVTRKATGMTLIIAGMGIMLRVRVQGPGSRV